MRQYYKNLCLRIASEYTPIRKCHSMHGYIGWGVYIQSRFAIKLWQDVMISETLSANLKHMLYNDTC